MREKEDELKVYKANKLIEARYNLSLNEQKLILYAASQVNSFSDEVFPTLKLSVLEFFKLSGNEESKNHEYIRNIARGLMQKQLEIQLPNGGWELIQWVTKSKYEPNEGIISFQFHPDMIPYLLRLNKHYKGYPLQQVMQLNSKYSIRLYELLIQYEYSRHKSLNIEVKELRKKMGLLNNEYDRFTDFENRVIKVAVTELNNQSNIFVTYEKIKKGRSIHEIKFKFEIKKDEKIKQIEELRKLKDAGLSSHIEAIKELFNDEKLVFTDLEIDKAYMLVYNKLNGIEFIQDCLNDAVYRYMLYYYEYTKEKAGNHAYNYYLNLLENDYARICQLYKFGRSPQSIIYGNLL